LRTIRAIGIALVISIASSIVIPANADEPGNVSWFDLVTEDAAKAIYFYEGLFA
jgi:hypothetical protein